MHDGALALGPGDQVRHVQQRLQGFRLPRQSLRVPVRVPRPLLAVREARHFMPMRGGACCCGQLSGGASAWEGGCQKVSQHPSWRNVWQQMAATAALPMKQAIVQPAPGREAAQGRERSLLPRGLVTSTIVCVPLHSRRR